MNLQNPDVHFHYDLVFKFILFDDKLGHDFQH